ncbi:MAG TPA: hypothetical protein VNT75_10080 [Symbiobacteriaceae bacterium]|nr:hypothetical protein [Symbiobacteriaceae bacterium]
MRRAASVFSGLAMAVAVVLILLWAGVVEIPIPLLVSGMNFWLVFPILLAGLLAGGYMPDSALWRWGGPLLLLVVLAFPVAAKQYTESRSQAEITARQRRVQEIADQALLAAQALAPGEKAELGHSLGENCGGRTVRTQGSRGVAWHWYDGARGQIVATVTAEQLLASIGPLLPPGYRAVSAQPGFNRNALEFHLVRGSDGAQLADPEHGAPRYAQVIISEECEFAIYRVDLFNSQVLYPYIPLMSDMQPAFLARRGRQEREQAAHAGVVSEAFGASGEITWASPLTFVDSRHLARASGGGRTAWYWLRRGSTSIERSVTLDQMRQRVSELLPAGAVLKELQSAGPIHEIRFTYEQEGRLQSGLVWIEVGGFVEPRVNYIIFEEERAPRALKAWLLL